MLAVAEVVIQRALDHHLRQLAQQAALTGQLQPAGARPLGKLPQQLIIGGREPRSVLAVAGRHSTQTEPTQSSRTSARRNAHRSC